MNHDAAPRKRKRRAAAVLVGCAGWTLPRAEQPQFSIAGSHLERYASRFSAVEINSSFYRPHRPATYARWSASVPAAFRFSVKIPRAITHDARLHDSEAALDDFLSATAQLGERLGCLLVQLPPSLILEPPVSKRFFAALRSRVTTSIVCEPRHPTWFTPAADAMLQKFQIARAAVDPAPVPAAAGPGGWPDVVYYRLHGSPRMYYSTYSAEYLDELSSRLRLCAAAAKQVWCIFDNTALGAATSNALQLLRRLHGSEEEGSRS